MVLVGGSRRIEGFRWFRGFVFRVVGLRLRGCASRLSLFTVEG